MRNTPHLIVASSLALLSTCRADGLADLRGALGRLQGLAPIKATLEIKSWRHQGEGKDGDDKQGQASLMVEDSTRGLQLTYGKELLARTDAEEKAGARDKNAHTPTLYALHELGTSEAHGMVSAAGALTRTLDEMTFKGEALDSYAGKPARRLSFTLPIDKLPDHDRKYVKQFDTNMDIWIAADGSPLASSMKMNLSGRAFLVVSFEQQSEETRSYAIQGDRLLLVRKEEKGKSSGAGEHQEFRVSKTLSVQS